MAGSGQVFAVRGMYASMLNGLPSFVLRRSLKKWLWKVDPSVGLVSWHWSLSGSGAVRFTSSWGRQANRVPSCLTCRVCAASAERSPRTPGQRPYRLSKLWFSW